MSEEPETKPTETQPTEPEKKAEGEAPKTPCLSVFLSQLPFSGPAWDSLLSASKEVHASKEFTMALVSFLGQQGEAFKKIRATTEMALKKGKELDGKLKLRDVELSKVKGLFGTVVGERDSAVKEVETLKERERELAKSLRGLEADVGIFVRTVNESIAEQNSKCGEILAALESAEKAVGGGDTDKKEEKETVSCGDSVKASLTMLSERVSSIASVSASLLQRMQKLEGEKGEKKEERKEEKKEEDEGSSTSDKSGEGELAVVEEMYFNSVALAAKMNVFTREQNRIHIEKMLREKKVANAKVMRTKTLGRFKKGKTDAEIEAEFASVDDTLPVLPDIPTLFDQIKQEGVKREDWPRWIAEHMIPLKNKGETSS